MTTPYQSNRKTSSEDAPLLVSGAPVNAVSLMMRVLAIAVLIPLHLVCRMELSCSFHAWKDKLGSKNGNPLHEC